MSDLKSKLPDMNEISSIAGKLFKDIKKSVSEIIDDYKTKHPDEPKVTPTVTPTEPPTVTPSDTEKKDVTQDK